MLTLLHLSLESEGSAPSQPRTLWGPALGRSEMDRIRETRGLLMEEGSNAIFLLGNNCGELTRDQN